MSGLSVQRPVGSDRSFDVLWISRLLSAQQALVGCGREGGIRTRDLSVPNRARYQASLLPDVLNSLLDVRCTRFLGPEPRREVLSFRVIRVVSRILLTTA